jgi:hypothetical protein
MEVSGQLQPPPPGRSTPTEIALGTRRAGGWGVPEPIWAIWRNFLAPAGNTITIFWPSRP